MALNARVRPRLERARRRDPIWLARTGAVLVLATLLAACGKTSYTAAEHLERARGFSAQNDPVSAIIEVKNALQQEPGDAEARWLLGVLHLEVMDGATSYAELRRAADLGIAPERVRVPLMRAALLVGNAQEVLDLSAEAEDLPEAEAIEALALRAQALLMRGEVAAAREVLLEATRRDPAQRDVLYASAWADILSRRPAEARAGIERLIALYPDYARGHELLGDMERDGGQLEAAETAYTAALAAAQQPFSPRIKRAMVRIYREDYAGAKEDLDVLSRRYQRHPAIHFARGLIAFDGRAYPDAQREFEQTLSLAPNHMLSVYYLGATHFAQGNWRIAENHLARFNARYPHIGEGARLLALARAKEGDLSRAESTLRSVLQNDPGDVAALRLISNIQMSQGKDQEALARLRQLVSLDPDSARARAQLGLALLEQGGRQEGMSELETAIALDPDNMAGLEVALVVERIRAGEFDEALVTLAEMKQRNPRDPLLSNLEGTALLGKGDMAGARTSFEEAIGHMPGYAPAVRNLAAVFARQGDLGAAIAQLEQGLIHSPEAMDLMLYLSSLQMRNGQVPQAYETLSRAVKTQPESLAARLALSGNRVAGGQPQEAIDVLEQVRELHGASPLWMRHMALAQGAAGNGAEAAALVRRLLQREPDSGDLHLALARALGLAGDWTGAREALERALELEPGQVAAATMLARLHLTEGRYAEAVAMLRGLSRKVGESTELNMLEGQAAMGEGRFQDAVNSFRRVLRAEPGNGDAVTALYQAQWEGNDRAGAIATARAWSDARPEDHVARYNVALLHMAAGDRTAAIREMEAVARHLPDNGAVLNNLAWLLRPEDPRKALGLAERAVRLLPDSAGALHTLGSIQLDLGQDSVALETLGKARKADPEHAGVRYQYARALVRSDRGAEAKPLLEGLLEVDDANVPGTEVRAMLDGI